MTAADERAELEAEYDRLDATGRDTAHITARLAELSMISQRHPNPAGLDA